MKWVRRALVAVVILVGVPLGVGSLLPVEHVATTERVVSATPDEVWAVITDFQAMPGWRPGLESVEVLSAQPGAQRWRETGADGTLTFAVTVWQPTTRLVTRITDEGLPFGGRWTYQVSAEEGGTRLTLTENGEVYSALYRFVSRFIIGHERSMTEYLEALERRFAGA